MKNRIMAKERRAKSNKSLKFIINILPQSILRAIPVAAAPGIMFRNTNARAIIIEKRKPMTTLLSNLAFSERGPSIRAVVNEKIMALNKGSMLSSNPRAAPANAACDIQYPIDTKFILTTSIPTVEQDNPASTEPIRDIIRKKESSTTYLTSLPEISK